MKKKLLIGVPGFNGIVPEAQQSFMAMLFRAGRELLDFDVAVEIVTKKEQFRARNALVDQAIAGGFDWLLMLDDDMVLPPDAVPRLLAHDKDVCGALYYQRGGGYHPVVMELVETDTGDWASRFIRQHHPILRSPGLHQVDIIGGGCMLFKTEMFRKLMPPYFWWEHTTGTDIAICKRFHDAGVQVWCDTSLEIGHVQQGRQIVTSRTIPLHLQEIGALTEQLWQDAVAYFGLPEEALESAMYQAALPPQRVERWARTARDTWEGIKDFYQHDRDWHIQNLLYWNVITHTQPKEWAFTRIDGLLKPGGTVLDYGLGLGHTALPLVERGHRVYGIEIAEAATLEFVRWRMRKHDAGIRPDRHQGLVILETTEPVPTWVDEQDLMPPCDGALCLSMIDHCVDPVGVVTWLHQHVRPGGFLVLDYWTHTDANNPQHLARYDVPTFEQTLRQVGWEVAPEYPWLFFRR